MPETKYHLAKADHNKDVATHLEQSGQKYIDWAVTARFYTAMHLVDALLALMTALPKDEQHPRKHVAAQNVQGNGGAGRNQLVRKHMKPVSRKYLSLYDASRRSRYDMEMLGEGAYQRLCDQLDAVEKYVRMQLVARAYQP